MARAGENSGSSGHVALAARWHVRGDGAAEAGGEEMGRDLVCFVKNCGLDLPPVFRFGFVVGDLALH